MTVSSWLNENWFSLVQTVSFVGGMLVAGAKIQEHTQEQRLTNIIALCDRHRSLWTEVVERNELKRVMQPNADLGTPLSLAEEEFLNLVIIHYELGWRMAKRIGQAEIDAQKRDARKFFSLPCPRAVWEKTKNEKNLRFVRFIERALAK